MNQFNVATRIILGFATVLIFAVGIVVVSLYGLSSVNQRLQDVSNIAIPMVQQSEAASKGVLSADIALLEASKQRSTSGFNHSRNIYLEQKETVEDSLASLDELIVEGSLAQSAFESSKVSVEAFFASAETVLSDQERWMQLSAEATEISQEFTDMEDEIASYGDDIYASVEDDDALDQLSDLMEQIEELRALVDSSVQSRFVAEVNNNMAMVKSAGVSLKNGVAELGTSEFVSGISSYKDFVSASERFVELASGEAGVLVKHAAQLQQLAAINKELANNSQLRSTAIDNLTDVGYEVESLVLDYQTLAESSVTASNYTILSFASIAVFLSMVISYLITQSIRKPLKSMLEVSKRVATGDLSQTLENHSKDELGALARAMSELIAKLRGMINEIGDNSAQLSATAEQTAATSHQSLVSIGNQRAQTDMIATAVEEMSATVEEVSRHISETQSRVENAHDQIVESESVNAKNIDLINGLAHDIAISAQVVEDLSERSTNIGSVLEVIRSVAEQTNLLALNAAIEAARAGEQGRGFAVVADEVRTLASRTHASTEEIQGLIESLQTSANEAVSSMHTSQAQASESVQGMAVSGELLSELTQSMTEIKEMSYQIASAAEEQACTTREQSKNVNVIAQVANETYDGATETEHASKELANMAEKQMSLIGKFTL